ncbi:diacylglycerol kinase like protein [Babesia gibsoni]|uniref:Diacylglycerol kinase n=1 Tax=Babesia gibsoni TaxID=33632 RepID=A0AAD8UTK9_BABGI|nr:diacylglycerol kinase like protein [Babesia gibsoni]
MEYIYFFVNPASGGKRAANFFEPDVKELHFSKPTPCIVRIYSLVEGESGNKPGFINLKGLLDSKVHDGDVKVIICGGDGSVMWVVNEVAAHGIDDEQLVFAVVPYGTGNDFARALHWNDFNGLMPFASNLTPLRQVLERASQATVVSHDFWHIMLTVEPEGSFNKINSKSRVKETLLDKEGNERQMMEFMMGNYFSFGVDARIGRGFDRKRSNSRFINKMIYITQGMKNSLKRAVRVDKQIDKVLSGESFSTTVFTTEAGNLDFPILPVSSTLIALNIPSYSAGINAFEKTSRVGLTNLSQEEMTRLNNVSQEMGDGQLEFIAYKNAAQIAFDYCGAGLARRIHAGHGPWKIIFKELHPREKVYFQVDGEFFVMHQPKEVVIRHAKTIKILK